MRCNITCKHEISHHLTLFALLNGVSCEDEVHTVHRPQQLYHQTIKLPLVILRNLIRCLIYKRFSVLTDFVKDWNCFKTLFFIPYNRCCLIFWTTPMFLHTCYTLPPVGLVKTHNQPLPCSWLNNTINNAGACYGFF